MKSPPLHAAAFYLCRRSVFGDAVGQRDLRLAMFGKEIIERLGNDTMQSTPVLDGEDL